jgi:hypothetical protein
MMREVTDYQIETLRSEAAQAGDTLQVALCDVALASGLTDMAEVGEHRAELEALGAVPEHVDADVKARELCAKAIADAQAQTALEEQWWAWHDEDYSRWDYEMQEAEAACAAWARGESDVGPDRGCTDDEVPSVQTSYQAIEDNGGGLHLAVFDGGGNCTHFMSNFELHDGSLRECVQALSDGESPNGWDGLSVDPQGEYNAMTATLHGWTVVADDNFIYRDRMGSAARREFGIDEQ